jgi:histidine ammonia-lyase
VGAVADLRGKPRGSGLEGQEEGSPGPPARVDFAPFSDPFSCPFCTVKKLTLDGQSLLLDDFQPLLTEDLAKSAEVQLAVSKAAMKQVRAARKLVEDHVKAGNVVYGLTTGFGKLKSVAIATEDLEELQRNLVLSHCCGVGAHMPLEEVRSAQILRLNG